MVDEVKKNNQEEQPVRNSPSFSRLVTEMLRAPVDKRESDQNWVRV